MNRADSDCVQDAKDSTLMELIAQNEETPMALKVYNIKSQTTRGMHYSRLAFGLNASMG